MKHYAKKQFKELLKIKRKERIIKSRCLENYTLKIVIQRIVPPNKIEI